MLFNSFSYLIFLVIIFIVYWITPHRFRWVLLLISSYYFYMSWNVKYIVLILFTTFISYLAGRLLENESRENIKKWIVAGTLVSCLGVLFVFKYFNFFSLSVQRFFEIFQLELQPITLKLLLPVGISFYTFQTLSYVIDVYRGTVPAEHHFGKYATFISFFPQLVAGPIERTRNLLPQLKEKKNFNYEQSTYGLKLMTWGYFKKMVIADNLAKYVSVVFNDPSEKQGFALLLATFFFTIQIYCDFSGYSDIAIGTAKLLGIDLMTNFRSPYFSQSIKEFWSRWHVSLSTWFKDYVYIPLGGNRVSKIRQRCNVFITFLLSGLWHGANWTFVIWGFIHGILRIIEEVLAPICPTKDKGVGRLFKTVLVFSLCSFAWIFFVSNSVSDALYVITNLFVGIKSPLTYLTTGMAVLGLDKVNTIILGLCILLLVIYDYINLRQDCIELISSKPLVIRYTLYMALLCVILYLRAAVEAEFVYFQF